MDRMSDAGLAAMAINAEHGDRRAADDLYAEARRARAAEVTLSADLAESQRQISNLLEGIRCVLASTSEQWIHDVLNASMDDGDDHADD